MNEVEIEPYVRTVTSAAGYWSPAGALGVFLKERASVIVGEEFSLRGEL